MNLANYIARQQNFSLSVFGPADRANGIIQHIEKELAEIKENPKDLSEWCDVIILALDGAWRQGYTPLEIEKALEEKQVKNMNREWPNWRTLSEDSPIEHVRSKDEISKQA